MNLSSTSEQFYPTPESLITKMLEGLDIHIDYILEPSAGKGDIADAVVRKIYGTNYWHESKIREMIDCVEINPNLQHILSDKHYRVVHDDFLSYRTKKQYDLIVMNPPFNNGDLHLLHALDLVREGGTVICILNAETLRNTYTKSRQLLMQKLNEYGASIEYLQNEFIDAEHKTDVEIALVKVTTPVVEHVSFIFEGLKGKEYPEVDYECKALVGGDFIAQIVKQYEMEVEMGIKLIEEYKAMEPLILNSLDKSNNYKSPMLSLKVYNDDATVNEYIKAVRNKYWHALFQNDKFTGKLTSNLQNELYDKVKELEDYDFSVYNIGKVYQEIMQKLNMGVEETIMKLFDKLSGEHSWYPETQKNIHYYNGWATNKAHKINKKVIIPICGAFSSYGWSRDTFETYEVYKVMSDIEKTLTYLSTGDTFA